MDVESITKEKLKELAMCSICRDTFNDPRELPCRHTMCLACLQEFVSRSGKQPGESIPCPDCRQVFRIPSDGVDKMPKNFWVERMFEFASISEKMTCSKHLGKQLDIYCIQCEMIICVCCLDTNHEGHKWSEVTETSKKFRETIDNISALVTLDLTTTMNHLRRKEEDFFTEISEKETAIIARKEHLKVLIDEATKTCLDELGLAKDRGDREMKKENEKLEDSLSDVKNFKVNCDEKTPAGFCQSMTEIIGRAIEFKMQADSLYRRNLSAIHVSLAFTNIEECLMEENIIGKLKSYAAEADSSLVVVGLHLGETVTNQVFKVSLSRPEALDLDPVPTKMQLGVPTAVCSNILFVAGIGNASDEIWKYDVLSKWSKCHSLLQGRREHCSTFVDGTLYIYGGILEPGDDVLNTVEAYNPSTNVCKQVGKLSYGVHSAASVAYGRSVYVFGGCEQNDKTLPCIQVYSTDNNTCEVLPVKMPPSYIPDMRAALWANSVILLGNSNCFLFDFENETWQERKRFKTDVFYFGLILERDKIFVVGGNGVEIGKDGKKVRKCRNDVRCVHVISIINDEPIDWWVHAKLKKAICIDAHAGIKFPIG